MSLANLTSGCVSVAAPPPKTTAPPAAVSARGPVFQATWDSDEWVRRTMVVQTAYRRVLLVSSAAAPAATIQAKRLDLNAPGRSPGGEGRPAETVPLRVDKVFPTLQSAADFAEGGDLVAIAPGTYKGFCLGDKSSAKEGRFVHFQALGAPGEVVIDEPCPDDGARWMIYLRAAHHVILEGLNLKGRETPGDTEAKGPWAGIMLDGDFGRTGKLTHHVAITGVFSHHHAAWGLHSTDSHSVLIQDSVFGFSAREHSAYVSDGSDDYVIRRDVFIGSRSGGLQVNTDPEASLRETIKHPALAGAPPYAESRAWAEDILSRATSLFGERGFPDGRGEHFLIEDNVITGNGKGGGGSINLAAMLWSRIQNNLIYDNANHGIAEWDNKNPFDAEAVAGPPETLEEASDVRRLPLFGCHDNVIRNNTVLMANAGRAAVLIVNGSYGTRLRNNVLVNDVPVSMDVDRTSIFGLDSACSVANEVRYRSAPFNLPSLSAFPEALFGAAISRFEEPRSTFGVTQDKIRPEFVAAGSEPWILLDGAWWKPNPARPDFRPKRGSKLLADKGDPSDMPPRDLLGRPRTSADIGAFAQAP
ncbi:MAG: right-handed parallel beta-helix repeat-containing protein [Polyangiaceae bacterium]